MGVVGGGGQFECYYENIDALKLYYYVFIYDLGNLWKHNDTIWGNYENIITKFEIIYVFINALGHLWKNTNSIWGHFQVSDIHI